MSKIMKMGAAKLDKSQLSTRQSVRLQDIKLASQLYQYKHGDSSPY